ncbi:ACP phosphodiesterase [Aliiglaciecola sp. CAU 1673]|uniref:acyl carrier protein phosphodiesterase n=1 Tax=Aliiglaciecola sp. CAU 1673 TaxID=3032595 RepID=UPI0023D99C95|nr:ACP phosphodiesterase [Aliiglaciecola sp. CAU 1673]MDF2176901.1 ACP phosphodiesterase [Aliiglaciecola sp. CAU 1673]
MNYLAHLFLAQPSADSYFGNLLGDFSRGIDASSYSEAVQAGLANHRLVDRFTDTHPIVRDARQHFSPKRRRFAGIAMDVLFDHFLICHWQDFSDQLFESFCQQTYSYLGIRLQEMPPRMQHVVGNMIEHHWFAQYQSLHGVGRALDNIARRIRFENDFSGCLDEIERYHEELESCFLQFFPELIQHVKQQGLEEWR